jgi:hypothetical protein
MAENVLSETYDLINENLKRAALKQRSIMIEVLNLENFQNVIMCGDGTYVIVLINSLKLIKLHPCIYVLDF